MSTLTHVSNSQLLAHFSDLIRIDRKTTSELLRCIAEIDARKLWAEHACSSMHAFCVERFFMSDASAFRRIHAARAAHAFPILFEMVQRGDIHLSAITVLSSVLTEQNHREVLRDAIHKTKRQCQELVVRYAPKPDAPSRVVQLPCKKATSSSPSPEMPLFSAAPLTTKRQVEPLAPRRYKIEITVDEQTIQTLRKLQDLMSHSIPNRDEAAIIGRALSELLVATEKKKFAATEKPRPSARTQSTSRNIPAAVRRSVYERDQARCAFTSRDGVRCSSTSRLEFHHEHPFAHGGEHEAENISLRCRAHNQYEADLVFGSTFMNQHRTGVVRETIEPYQTRSALPRIPGRVVPQRAFVVSGAALALSLPMFQWARSAP